MSRLAAFIADVLTREAFDLSARWRARARSVAPRMPGQVASIDAGQSECLVRTVARAVRGDAQAHDAIMRAGWDYGAAMHVAGMSLHYMLKELDLLMAMALYAGERALAHAPPPGWTAADGVGVARRVQRIFSLLMLSASKGFTHAYLGRLREEYRDLRHELRNPLGTIRSAVSLMEDESVPPELRDSPRFRAMVLRNASSIDTVIAKRLSDASALVPAFGRQRVSLGDIALSVRRDLRDEAREKSCEIVVDASLPTLLVDSASFELALRSAVRAGLRAAACGSAVTVTLRGQHAHSAVVAVTFRHDGDGEAAARDCVPEGALDLARELLGCAGGKLWSEAGGWCLEVPMSAADAAHDVARAG